MKNELLVDGHNDHRIPGHRITMPPDFLFLWFFCRWESTEINVGKRLWICPYPSNPMLGKESITIPILQVTECRCGALFRGKMKHTALSEVKFVIKKTKLALESTFPDTLSYTLSTELPLMSTFSPARKTRNTGNRVIFK